MVRAFQTTIERNQSKVLLIASSGVFVTQLCHAIRALHLDPVCIDPARFLEPTLDSEIQTLGREAYVCIWLDFPVFSDQEQKKKKYIRVYETLQLLLRIPLIVVTFDAFKSREIGREGKNPTYATQWLVQTALKGLQQARHVDYQHVIYPYEGGVSITQRLLLEKISMGNNSSLEGECSPVWFTDVIEHVVSLLYDVSIPGGVFEGKERVSFKEMEKSLRKIARHPSLASAESQFPYSFAKNPGQIGQVSVTKMLDELALVIPKPKEQASSDVRIEKTVILPPKKVEKKKAKPKLMRFLGMSAALIMIVYMVLSAYFLFTFFSVRSTLAAFVLKQTTVSSQGQTQSLSSQLSHMHSFVSIIPFPYSLMEIHLDKQRILEGITSMKTLVDAMTQFETEKQSLYFSKVDQPEAQFDAVYQELSSLQAKLSQGDLTFDLVFGIDGLSEKMRQKLVEVRQEVTQEKAIASFFPELIGKTRRSTVALVSFSTQTSRPLFGIPEQVVLATFEDGKMLTINSYSPTDLDTFLKGITQPPEEMTKHLGISNWKLSQGAWSVDGPTAARQIAWFLSKELHQEIDSLLLFNEDTPSRAIAQLSQSKLSTTLIGQSPDEKSVLGTQTPTNITDFINIISSSDTEAKQEIIESLQQEFSKGNAVLFVKDPGTEKTLQALSWDGSISTPVCPTQFSLERNCVVSTRYVGEYDLEKATEGSPFVSKKDQYQDVVLSEEGTMHTDTIVYPVVSSGHQRKLLKYVVDQDSALHTIAINGRFLDSTEYIVSQEFSKSVFSFAVDLDTVSDTTVVVSYETGAVDPSKSAFVLFAQKQLGKENENFQLTVHYPKAYTARVIAPAAVSKQQTSTFATTLQTNKLFAIGF